MSDKHYRIEKEVPYDLKEAVRMAGGVILPAHTRKKKNELWVTDSEEKRNKIYDMIDSYQEKIKRGEPEKIERMLSGEEEKGLIKEKNKRTAYFSIPKEYIISIGDNGKYDWTKLLSESGWDSLVAVQMIRKYGLPEKESERIKLLENFSNRVRGEQYNVVYEDLCEYSEVFRKAYGPDVVRAALLAADIKDGFNFTGRVKESGKISEEVKRLLLFVFPIVRRYKEEPVMEREKYL